MRLAGEEACGAGRGGEDAMTQKLPNPPPDNQRPPPPPTPPTNLETLCKYCRCTKRYCTCEYGRVPEIPERPGYAELLEALKIMVEQLHDDLSNEGFSDTEELEAASALIARAGG